MPGTGIFRGLAQIINGGEKIIFDNRFTDTKRMRDLAGGFNIKLRFIRQHTTKHSDIYRYTVFT
ncbi:Uncharacterised protein [Shigella sonnei]|nr:Uncharacterised protein [Shigella sonnei]CSG21674.1 Uncharacterised protein [Shigella sonnei]CSG31037.1 Uncharacterised protein [Shigella sonnei]CSG73354.1 Uncharacterised protein [Shigella sonnei]CSJ88903.1 Uncharacterised protein [Shigella sonnei]